MAIYVVRLLKYTPLHYFLSLMSYMVTHTHAHSHEHAHTYSEPYGCTAGHRATLREINTHIHTHRNPSISFFIHIHPLLHPHLIPCSYSCYSGATLSILCPLFHSILSVSRCFYTPFIFSPPLYPFLPAFHSLPSLLSYN